MLRVFPSLADEETLLDEADNRPANQEGPASEAVKEAEDWTWEAVVEEVGGDDDDAVDDVVVIL